MDIEKYTDRARGFVQLGWFIPIVDDINHRSSVSQGYSSPLARRAIELHGGQREISGARRTIVCSVGFRGC
jgi:hypothetical protein